MAFGDSEVVRSEGSCKLLRVGTRDGESYCVISDNKMTQPFDDYENATEEYNLRCMQEKFGEDKQLL
jgi:hypothetical protein